MTGKKSSAQRLLIVVLELAMVAAIVLALIAHVGRPARHAGGPVPRAGAKASPGRAAVPPRTLLPDVTRQKVGQARATLRRGGYGVKLRRAPSATVPAGAVASTSPPPFSLANRGGRVVLVVSAGPPPTTVPRLLGAPLSVAERRLRHAGLKLSVTTERSTRPANAVLAQTPPPGARVRRGAVVHLVVAKAIPRVTVPRVTGEPEERAAARISALGLALAFVAHGVNGGSLPGVVLAQSPKGGQKATRGSTVTLTVGKPPRKKSRDHHHHHIQ